MAEKDLLVEIGTEELPPKALKSLGQAFLAGMESGLAAAGLAFASSEWFATPRRLAVRINGLATSQADRDVEKFGPAVAAAFDKEGKPTRAAEGFARSCNVEVKDLEQGDKDGVVKLLYRSHVKGRDTGELLQDLVQSALDKLPIPKRMRWGSSREEFVRPVHWILILFGEQTVDATILGIKAGDVTFGHRFHHPDSLTIKSPAEYASVLECRGYVIADFESRKSKIRDLVQAQATEHSANVVIDAALLDEVASLVEWPVALTGDFDQRFLEVPKEALVSSLTSHQKCFYLVGDNGDLLPHFIAVSNLESRDPSKVIEGNERVIRPRLADADFFFQTDRRETLESRRERLKQIVFQQQLGTVYEKSARVASLARLIAKQVGGKSDACERAAQLGKCDLVTNMVGEFAELQGIMGYYYALHDGEDPEVAAALNEQYMPRHAGDNLPESLTGSIVSLAEKIDTVAGLFVIGQPPTGSKDPFALRRAAIGILRILVEKKLDLDLKDCIDSAVENFAFLKPAAEVNRQILDFFLERFRFWYQDKGIATDVYQSVLAVQPTNPLDFDSRILAVNHFRSLDEAKALTSANKRVANILKDVDASVSDSAIDSALFLEPAEKELADVLDSKELEVAPYFDARNYRKGLEELAALKEPVDRFFDDVMVMVDDAPLRDNRLALLAHLRKLFLRVADISYLHDA